MNVILEIVKLLQQIFTVCQSGNQQSQLLVMMLIMMGVVIIMMMTVMMTMMTWGEGYGMSDNLHVPD